MVMLATMLSTMLSTLLLLLVVIVSSSSSSTSPYYTSVTALDKYGNSVQLQHARDAATRHGTPIVAASYDKGIVVVSLLPPTQHGIIIQDENGLMIQRLSLYSSSSNPMGMVCTGIKADARWLIQTLREYQKRNWEVYNFNNLSPITAQQATAQALLTFMGYNRDKELSDGLPVVIVDKDDTTSWSRPLGVQTMLLSGQTVTVVDPSGTFQSYSAQAIGKKSAELNSKLEELDYEPNQSLETVRALLIDTMNQVFDNHKNGDSCTTTSSAQLLLVEVITTDGVKRLQGPSSSQQKSS